MAKEHTTLLVKIFKSKIYTDIKSLCFGEKKHQYIKRPHNEMELPSKICVKKTNCTQEKATVKLYILHA